jgi:hypothetical protein
MASSDENTQSTSRKFPYPLIDKDVSDGVLLLAISGFCEFTRTCTCELEAGFRHTAIGLKERQVLIVAAR